MQIVVKNNGLIVIKQFIDRYKGPLVPALDALLKGAAREAGGPWGRKEPPKPRHPEM